MSLQRRENFGRMAAPHQHHNVEFNLVIEGTATYVLAHHQYELRPQSLVWLFPQQDHLLTNRSEVYRDWLGLFDPALMHYACTTSAARTLIEPDPPGYFVRQLSAETATRLEWLFAYIAGSTDDGTQSAGLEFALLATWEAFRASDQLTPASPVHPAVAQAAHILCANPDAGSVEKIAHDVGLSPNYLGRMFHSQIGTSISQFRNEQRLRRFLHLYPNDDTTSILDAAMASGFGSYAQFYRVFTKLTGTNPAYYLHKLRTANQHH